MCPVSLRGRRATVARIRLRPIKRLLDAPRLFQELPGAFFLALAPAFARLVHVVQVADVAGAEGVGAGTAVENHPNVLAFLLPQGPLLFLALLVVRVVAGGVTTSNPGKLRSRNSRRYGRTDLSGR